MTTTAARRDTRTPLRRALVIGGGGMLADCTSALVAEGWHVVLPSRRYAPIPIVPGTSGTGRALWVGADWDDPDDLVARARRALGASADLLVVWVRSAQRGPLLRAAAPLLSEGAPVVEVHGSAAADPVRGWPDPVLAEHPTQQVMLGFMRAGTTNRRLSHDEISQGILSAVRRALAGRPPAAQQVGEALPWGFRV